MLNKDLIADKTVRASDPQFIRELVKASKVFSEIEAETAGELAEAVLDGSDLSYKFYFIRTKDGTPIAYSCFGEIPLTDKRYDLYWIVVHPDYQNQGLAKEVSLQTDRSIIASGGKHLYAETSGTDLYKPARSFYLKDNYIQVACYPDFYKKDDDKIVFVKRYNQ